MNDVVIIGGGISGLTAAIYTARSDLKPIVITGIEKGGQLMLTSTVENFPGFPDGVQGPELIELCKKQAKKHGAEFIEDNVSSFRIKKDHFAIGINDKEIYSKSVIIASGASAKFLGLNSEKKFIGRGVSSCATCDGAFFRNKEIMVVGGGDTACEDSLFLTKFAKKVIMVHRRDQLKASKIMQARVLKNEKIEILFNMVVEDILGDKSVSGVILNDVKLNKIIEKKIDGIFIAIGHTPNTEIFKGLIEMNENGFIKTDKRTRTNIDGVFACGDVQDPIYKQAITAAGSGCQSAIEVEKYLEMMKNG